MNDAVRQFEEEKRADIEAAGKNESLRATARCFMEDSAPHKYSYFFKWMGRPIIQFPQDIMAMQELIWEVKPDLIIETGIAHGGSIIFHASMLELLGHGEVLGVDIDIREHNRAAIEAHPMVKRIHMIEGSSIDEEIARQVHQFAEGKPRVMVVLDSNHTHDHVMRELDLYASLVKKGSYLIVLDTGIEDADDALFSERPWGKGNNPKTAVWAFLEKNDRFVVDKDIDSKLLITCAPNGYLKCIKD
ncbi:MAG: cephalosporin hydroxylase family protein [Lentisphaerae bacterium]|nr:cephalosporin hydroxylase family protein [Lentisphaerota bacterium]